MKSENVNKIKIRRKSWRWFVLLTMFAIGLALVIFAARELWVGMRDDAAAQAEYEQLRELSANIVNAEEPAILTQEQIAALLRVFSEINPDFVGWITIPGTTVDYPIVRGADNARYLNTTFSGASNPAGAIFMDYRAIYGFKAPASLIHGHNMRDGSMFAPLVNYMNREFMDNYPEIIILTKYGERLVYRVVKVRRTDAWDDVYALDFNNAEAAEFLEHSDAERVLILSTCLGGADRNARLLIFAAQ
ncbi:MAG: class B sortase [Oscillospiraceae bacterium]|nr:class B sortase [Oscillospiraceae bacterium]